MYLLNPGLVCIIFTFMVLVQCWSYSSDRIRDGSQEDDSQEVILQFHAWNHTIFPLSQQRRMSDSSESIDQLRLTQGECYINKLLNLQGWHLLVSVTHTTFSHLIPYPVYTNLISYLCVFIDIVAIFYNSSGSYVSLQRIRKTTGEITGVTSAAVIHSISPSPRQDMLPLHPQPTQSPGLSQSFIWATIPVSTFDQENPFQFFQSIGFNPLLLIYQRLLTLYHLLSWPKMRALQFRSF